MARENILVPFQLFLKAIHIAFPANFKDCRRSSLTCMLWHDAFCTAGQVFVADIVLMLASDDTVQLLLSIK